MGHWISRLGGICVIGGDNVSFCVTFYPSVLPCRAKIKNAFLFYFFGPTRVSSASELHCACGAAAPMLIDAPAPNCYATHTLTAADERPNVRASETPRYTRGFSAGAHHVCPNHNSISIGASLCPPLIHSSSPVLLSLSEVNRPSLFVFCCLFGLLVLMAMMLIKDLGVGDCAPRRTMDGGAGSREGRGGDVASAGYRAVRPGTSEGERTPSIFSLVRACRACACACERVMWVGGAVWLPCGGGGASGVPVVVGDAWPSAWLSGWVGWVGG